MKTSYYSSPKIREIDKEKLVSIAGRAPHFFKGREYKKLAPKRWFFVKYKEDNDEQFYTEQYEKEVLSQLDPQKVLEEIGEDSIILCWEKSGKFCHRHLIAKWLSENLNIEVNEL